MSGIDDSNARHRMLSRWRGLPRTKFTEVRVTVTTPAEGGQFLSDNNIVEILERYLVVDDSEKAKAHRGKACIWVNLESVPPSDVKVSIVPRADPKKLVLFEAYKLVWRFNPEREQWEGEIQSTRQVS